MKQEIESVEIKIDGKFFEVIVDPMYKSLSRAWENANRDVMATEVIGNNIPEDRKLESARLVLDLDRQLKESERTLLIAWYAVAKTDIRVPESSQFPLLKSIENVIAQRISELAMTEVYKPILDQVKTDELFSLTRFMGFSAAIVESRVRREVRCDAARACLPIPFE